MAIGILNGNVVGAMNPEMLAKAYDASKAYIVGDYCIKDFKLYRCIANATGAWQASKWELTDVGEEIKEAKAINFLSATLAVGETSLTFTSPLIKSTSLIDPYYFAESGATVEPISFTECTVSNGSLTMTFDAQDQALTIGIKISEV